MSDTRKLTVIGAGLAGSLLAIYLGRRGFEVDLFDSRPDMRREPIPAGRSINLALAERGLHALREVGLCQSVERFAIPMRGRMLHEQSGHLQFQSYGKPDRECIFSVPRGHLNIALLDAAEATGKVSIHFRYKLEHLDFAQGLAGFITEHDGSRERVAIGPVIGADGAGSAVRDCLSQYTELAVVSEVLDHGYKELSVPPRADGDFQLEPHALHIWPRGGYMLIALPNPDKSFTATLFLATEGEPGFDRLIRPERVESWFRREFPDAVPLMPDLVEDFMRHPLGLLGAVRCRRWHHGGQALLIGDAAHAIVPFHGQGMNCAFEDCSVLDRCLENTDRSWAELFAEFERLRLENTNAIADMALENYIEMRSSVRDPKFHLKKQLEQILEQRHPERFIPRYSMVMFHRIPYAIAQERGKIQEAILDELAADREDIEHVDLRLADRLIEDKLTILGGLQP
ncbi:MAG: FAD-dependent oxidoreductase [Gammaproteobacteria bacterium]